MIYYYILQEHGNLYYVRSCIEKISTAESVYTEITHAEYLDLFT